METRLISRKEYKKRLKWIQPPAIITVRVLLDLFKINVGDFIVTRLFGAGLGCCLPCILGGLVHLLRSCLPNAVQFGKSGVDGCNILCFVSFLSFERALSIAAFLSDGILSLNSLSCFSVENIMLSALLILSTFSLQVCQLRHLPWLLPHPFYLVIAQSG